jgi:hypothetical protein
MLSRVLSSLWPVTKTIGTPQTSRSHLAVSIPARTSPAKVNIHDHHIRRVTHLDLERPVTRGDEGSHSIAKGTRQPSVWFRPEPSELIQQHAQTDRYQCDGEKDNRG